MISHSSELSGAPRVQLNAALALSPDRYEVDFCYPEKGGMSDIAAEKGFRVIIIDNPQSGIKEVKSIFSQIALIFKRIRFILNIKRTIKRGDYDLIYLSSAASFYAGMALFALNKRVIWHIYEYLQDNMYNRFRRWVVAHFSNLIIFDAPADMEYFDNVLKHKSGRFIPNGVMIYDPAQLKPDVDFRKKCDYQSDDIIIASVSFLSRRKGIDVFLKALKIVSQEFPHVKGVIAGDTDTADPRFMNEIFDYAKEEMGGQVYFPGFCADVPSFLECVKIFVLPSRSDSMPLTVLEAMASGKAIVATDVGYLSKMLDAPNAGIIVPIENPEALAQAICALLSDEKRCRQIGAAAHQRAKDEYSMQKFNERINESVESLIRDL